MHLDAGVQLKAETGGADGLGGNVGVGAGALGWVDMQRKEEEEWRRARGCVAVEHRHEALPFKGIHEDTTRHNILL
jgi:hypothetical protein